MNRDTLMRILVGGLLAAGALWLVTRTEWVDAEVSEPPKGEAARNRYFAAQSLLRALGADVVKRTNLDAMPPRGARLVLLSRHWDLFPDRPARLRRWVEQGGHLVIMGTSLDQPQLKWLPVRGAEIPRDEKHDTNPFPRRPSSDSPCHELAVPEAFASTYADKRTMTVCSARTFRNFVAADGQRASWALRGERGTEVVRVAAGLGTVTVVGPWDLLDNRSALRMETPLAVAAALQAQRGAPVWFVAEEAREPLAGWLWQQAWPAIAAALLALALVVWRAGVRFGPVAAVPERHRRSMTEQITGTGHFLQRHGPLALHAAQVRALHETASRQLRGWQGQSHDQRVQAIAKATRLPAPDIARALLPSRRTSGQLAADLDLLETARRLLAPPSLPRSPPTTTRP